MDEKINTERIKKYDSLSRAKIYHSLLRVITDISGDIENLFSLLGTSEDARKSIKERYMMGYRIYLECWKIQDEYLNGTTLPLLSLEEEKRKLDLTYRETMKKMRETKNG